MPAPPTAAPDAVPCRSGRKAAGSGHEAETVDPADIAALDMDLAAFVYRRQQLGLAGQVPHQQGGAAIDKALGDAVVQRVRQPVLDTAGALLPVAGAVDPVRAV